MTINLLNVWWIKCLVCYVLYRVKTNDQLNTFEKLWIHTNIHFIQPNRSSTQNQLTKKKESKNKCPALLEVTLLRP